jgi:bla regulator protein BlaR1
MQYPFVNKKKRKVSAPFGPRVHPITKVKSHHNGVDMVDKQGTVLVAPEAGTVIEARKSNAPGGGYGYYVKFKGKSGAVHILAHMVADSLLVKKDQKIAEGQPLGKLGNTGASTGAHVHWEVQIKGKPVDPIKWVEGK